MNHTPMAHLTDAEPYIVLAVIFALVTYLWVAIATNHRGQLRRWPLYRYGCWFIGLGCAATAVVGPLANRAHTDFAAHMTGHLLLGMLAPILLVFAAPMTLLLRTLRVADARRLSRLLHRYPLRFISHPIVAAALNIGGLWLLYTSELYMAMQHNVWLHLIIHFHLFSAGYLFTASMIYIDPVAHRFSFPYRAAVFVIALAGHGILTKYIYAFPPVGVARSDAELGAMLMYYGGDGIEVILIIVLCLHWYKATRPPRPTVRPI